MGSDRISNIKYQISKFYCGWRQWKGSRQRAVSLWTTRVKWINSKRRALAGRQRRASTSSGRKLATGPAYGLTLVEFLTGFGVLGLISIMVATLYFAHVRLFSNQSTSIDVASQNKLALDEMVAQIREGQAVVTSCGGCAGDSTSSTLLVLQLWPLDSGSEPFQPQGTAYDYIVYKRDATNNTKLIKKIVADAASSRQPAEKIVATNIADLTFAYDDADPTQASGVTIALTTTATIAGRVHTTSQSAKAVLRNK